jgi:gas vesicle protein
MDEESTASEPEELEEAPEPAETPEPVAESRRSGPGFRLGLLFGLAAGAAAATIFAPSSGDEFRQRVAGDAAGGEGVTPDGLRAVLDRVRARVQEAAAEAQAATQFAEAESRARYEELTGQSE